jgi:hypothetical protein
MIKKHISLLIVAGVLAICAAGGFYWHFYIRLKPEPLSKTEIYRGVYYQSGIWADSSSGSGKYIVTEIKLDEPGVKFFIRPFYPKSIRNRNYTLWPVDLLRRTAKPEVIMNGTLYSPFEWYQSIPGMKVDSQETLVVAGRVSHIDPKSYLLWFDEKMNSHLETKKPPSPEVLAQAFWGVGMQAYLVNEGELNWGSFVGNDEQTARTLIGVDPDNKRLWLMAFENISPVGLGIFAIEQGVRYGGQLDAEGAATLILGANPKGLKSYTGLRGKRPLASVIGIQADPLPSD